MKITMTVTLVFCQWAVCLYVVCSRLVDPGWVSYNLAVFICGQCAHIHRSLGPHVSNVKSTTNEDWTTEQLQVRNTLYIINSSLLR